MVLLLSILGLSALANPIQFKTSLAENHPAVCRLYYYRESKTSIVTGSVITTEINTQEAGCSGTLIAPNLIATAAHCLNNRWEVERVDCGYTGSTDLVALAPIYKTDFYLKAPGDKAFFSESVLPIRKIYNSSAFINAANDYGLFVLETPSAISPMGIAASAKGMPITRRFLKNKKADQVECRISGYGDNPAGFSGVQVTVAVSPRALSIRDGQIWYKASTDYADQGDSGGALYCKSKSRPWTLIGITSQKESLPSSTVTALPR